MRDLVQLGLEYLRAGWRFRWYALIIAWVIALAGWAWVYRMPDVYRASARVYVDTESLLEPLLKGLTVSPRVDQRVAMVTRTLLSRPNLEAVARRADLDLSARSPEELERVVSMLQKEIQLSGSSRENLYAVAYKHERPDTARRVVEALLDLFVENSLGTTRQDVASSRTFIDAQIAQQEAKLQEVEERVKKFKEEHYGLLPGQGGGYYDQLRATRDALERAQLELNEAVSRRNTYYARMQELQSRLANSDGSVLGARELEGRIAELRQRIEALSTRYTDAHPDLIYARQRLEELQRERAVMQTSASGPGGFGPYAAQELQVAAAQAEGEVASLRARVSEYQTRLETLRSAVGRIPEIEAQYTDLTRDYEVIRQNYQRLLATRERAAMSGELERDTKTIDFRIVDPPYVEDQPVGPPRAAMSSAVLLAALGVGAGMAFGLSQLRPTIMSRSSLERVSGRPFLGAVALHEPTTGILRRRLGLMVYAATLACLLGAFSGLVALYSVT
ncbi:XrtA system polysaccharide chain length determinant [Arhodomonas sp. SL1]|uniref:XrtA system polysaccharide chain length determinant n=1 Tax=Arhodomonas sp. SL1 TaxID=3425691 RepID=UPI003F88243E